MERVIRNFVNFFYNFLEDGLQNSAGSFQAIIRYAYEPKSYTTRP